MKKSFLPRTENERLLWMENFASKLPTYSPKYNIDGADQHDMADSNAYYSHWIFATNQFKEYLSKLVQFKNDLANDKNAVSLEPVLPTLPAAPPAVTPGIFGRASAIALRIKNHKDYTEADGNDLGIEGETAAEPDINTLKPTITLRLVSGGSPEIGWVRGIADGIDILVDRGNGVWTFLTTDTIPNYIDTAPLPAAGASAVWKYRCIYRVGDAQAGQWSDIVSITVTGVM